MYSKMRSAQGCGTEDKLVESKSASSKHISLPLGLERPLMAGVQGWRTEDQECSHLKEMHGRHIEKKQQKAVCRELKGAQSEERELYTYVAN